MRVFVMINNLGIMINADVNANNFEAKADAMMDLFKIPVNVNVINHAMLQNIQIMKTVNVEKK